MLLIGLTGSIATGKTTCSDLLSKPPFSLPIIDADLLAREAVTPTSPLRKQGYDRIVSYFLPTTPDLLLPAEPGSGIQFINRPVLGRRVFGTDPQRVKDRAVLNKIVHPIVRRLMLWSVVRYWWEGHWAVILDIPLLFESGFDLLCGGVIVVGLKSQEVQIERLLARDEAQGGEMTREDAQGRVKSQMSVAEKVERVEKCWGGGSGDTRRKGYVVWNDGSKELLKAQLEDVIKEIKTGRAGWYTNMEVWFPLWTVFRAVMICARNWWKRRQYFGWKQNVKAKI